MAVSSSENISISSKFLKYFSAMIFISISTSVIIEPDCDERDIVVTNVRPSVRPDLSEQ